MKNYELSELEVLQKAYEGKELKDMEDRDAQLLASILVEREVKENFTMIVNENLLKEDVDYWEEITNMYYTSCPNCGEEVDLDDAEVDSGVVSCPSCSEDFDEDEAEQELKEIFEWWLVSSWLYDRLMERGEAVYTSNDYNYFWGRCTTGQAIALDYCIQDLAFDIYIK